MKATSRSVVIVLLLLGIGTLGSSLPTPNHTSAVAGMRQGASEGG